MTAQDNTLSPLGNHFRDRAPHNRVDPAANHTTANIQQPKSRKTQISNPEEYERIKQQIIAKARANVIKRTQSMTAEQLREQIIKRAKLRTEARFKGMQETQIKNILRNNHQALEKTQRQLEETKEITSPDKEIPNPDDTPLSASDQTFEESSETEHIQAPEVMPEMEPEMEMEPEPEPEPEPGPELKPEPAQEQARNREPLQAPNKIDPDNSVEEIQARIDKTKQRVRASAAAAKNNAQQYRIKMAAMAEANDAQNNKNGNHKNRSHKAAHKASKPRRSLLKSVLARVLGTGLLAALPITSTLVTQNQRSDDATTRKALQDGMYNMAHMSYRDFKNMFQNIVPHSVTAEYHPPAPLVVPDVPLRYADDNKKRYASAQGMLKATTIPEKTKYYIRLLEKPEIKAALDTIAYAEGTYYEEKGGYFTTYGHKTFEDASDHPRKVIKSGGIYSSAAGRFQILESTWDEFQKKLKLPDFGPVCQQVVSLALMHRRYVLDEVLKGDIRAAITGSNHRTRSLRMSYEWASMETNPYKQGSPMGKTERLVKVYNLRLNHYRAEEKRLKAASAQKPTKPVKSL